MWNQIFPAFRITLVLTILCGLIYPGIITGISKVLMPDQASGSLIKRDGKVIGSRLIGQNFAKPEYFHPRPSAAGNDGYDATASGGSNFGATSQKLIDRIKAAEDKFRKENPDFQGEIPADLLTTSASGLDPDLSPASALAQTARVAKARGVDEQRVRNLVNSLVEGRTLGFIGEPRVNVLDLNLKLDENFPSPRSASLK